MKAEDSPQVDARAEESGRNLRGAAPVAEANAPTHPQLSAELEGLMEAVFPRAQVQLCIVHKVRGSLKYVPWKERKAVAADLRAIYAAATLGEAEQALERFSERWDEKYPAISPSWRADWHRLTTFFDYPPEVRKVIYTTNAIESLNYSLRKVLKNRGAFPNDDSIMKVLFMGLHIPAHYEPSFWFNVNTCSGRT